MRPERYLSGKLIHNQQEIDALKELLRQYEDKSAISIAMIGGIFRDVVLRRGFKRWTADGSLCGDCLEQLLKKHTYLWLRGEKIKSVVCTLLRCDCLTSFAWRRWLGAATCWCVNATVGKASILIIQVRLRLHRANEQRTRCSKKCWCIRILTRTIYSLDRSMIYI